MVKAGISPHAPYTVGRKLFEKITDYAIAENIKISVHAAESLQEKSLLETGTGFFADVYKNYGFDWSSPNCSPIEYLDKIGVLRAKPLLAHCINVSDCGYFFDKKKQFSIAHCPKSNAKFGHGIAPLEKFLDAEIAVGFGSDSVASNNTCDILEEARFATLLARTRTRQKKIFAGERNHRNGNARRREIARFGKRDRHTFGRQTSRFNCHLTRQSRRKCLSMIFIPLCFSRRMRVTCGLTMVAGREVFRNGKAQLIDEDLLKKEMREIAEKLKNV